MANTTRIPKNWIDEIRKERAGRRLHGMLRVGQGGTGADNAEDALENLGGAAVGDATPENLGTASAGAATTASREDHVHSNDSNARVNVKKAGASVGIRRGINLIQGTNITLSVADDAANEEVDVTITAAAGAAGSTMAIVTWTGDGTDDRNITGFGIDPRFVMVICTDTGVYPRLKTADMGLYSKNTNGGYALNEVQALITDGIQVGSDFAVNKSGSSYIAIGFS